MRTYPADLPDLLSSPDSDADDTLLAAMYIRMWSAISGRSLPRGIPPCQLTLDTLIWFWADDYCTGRHAAPEAVPAGVRR